MRTRSRRRGSVACGLLVTIAGGLLVGGYGPVKTLASLEKIDDYPLYVMHYEGGYYSDVTAHLGIQLPLYRRIQRLMNPHACTSFVAYGDGEDAVFGRNFDWEHRSTLVLFTDPPGGYRSIANVDLFYLGAEGLQDIPWVRRWPLLAAPYAMMDGMNECGLAISQNAVPRRPMPYRRDRPTLISNQLMRLVLDRAANVDEAVDLLKQFNVVFPVIGCHLHVADATGHSAVIEYTGGRMVVLRSGQPWQISTNFLISETRPNGPSAPCRRYNHVYEQLQGLEGALPQQQAMRLLAAASQPDFTVWSAAYNLTTGRVLIAMGRDYENIHEFHLEMRGKR